MEKFLKLFLILFTLSVKIRAKTSISEEFERAAGIDQNANAEQLMDQNDSTAIDNAVMRLQSLVNRAQRLKTKLMRELQTTVSYLKFHFNQRRLFDAKMDNLANKSGVPLDLKEGGTTGIQGGSKNSPPQPGQRMLESPSLNNFGTIDHNEFEKMTAP